MNKGLILGELIDGHYDLILYPPKPINIPQNERRMPFNKRILSK
jgi:hypothetical protein